MLSAFNDFLSSRKEIATILLRIGLGGVLLWFGIDELRNPELWLGYLPAWLLPIIPFDATTFVLINGGIEVVLGALILVGFQTRLAALITAIHLLGITLSVGYNDIAIRDAGLTLMAFSLGFLGAGKWAIDSKNS